MSPKKALLHCFGSKGETSKGFLLGVFIRSIPMDSNRAAIQIHFLSSPMRVSRSRSSNVLPTFTKSWAWELSKGEENMGCQRWTNGEPEQRGLPNGKR